MRAGQYDDPHPAGPRLYGNCRAERGWGIAGLSVTSGQIRRAWPSRTRRDETPRDRDDRDRAVQSAREEAEGAGVGRFTLYVTTTVTEPDQLPPWSPTSSNAPDRRSCGCVGCGARKQPGSPWRWASASTPRTCSPTAPAADPVPP
jgi:hypothetical protein